MSLDGPAADFIESDVEDFIEYGISYRGELPRRGSWTPDYETAAQDAAWRTSVHGKDLGPIAVVSRRVRITCTPWVPAVRPDVTPEHERHYARLGTMAPPMTCDRCGFRAYVTVGLEGARLSFCFHHYNEHETALIASGWSIEHDNRKELVNA